MVEVAIPRRGLRRTLLAAAAALAIASALVQIPRYATGGDLYTLVDLFDSASEANLPTWFNALVLLACAVVAGVIAAAARKERRGNARHWLAAALVLAFAATDEASEIHELGNLARHVVGDAGVLKHPWVILGAVAVIAIAVFFRPFVASLPARTRREIMLAVGLYVGAALGLELVENAISAQAGRETLGRSLLETGEELIEMVAVVLLLDALLGYAQQLRLAFAAEVAPAGSGAPTPPPVRREHVHA